MIGGLSTVEFFLILYGVTVLAVLSALVLWHWRSLWRRLARRGRLVTEGAKAFKKIAFGDAADDIQQTLRNAEDVGLDLRPKAEPDE